MKRNIKIIPTKTDFNLDLIIADFRDWVKNNPGLYKNTINIIVPQDKQVTYLKLEDRDAIQNYIDSIAGCHRRNPDRENVTSIKFSLQTLYRNANSVVKNDFYNDEIIDVITTNDSSVFTTHNYEKTLPIIEETPVVESSIVVERDLSGNIIPPFDPNNPGPLYL